jgi:hypothetical protein
MMQIGGEAGRPRRRGDVRPDADLARGVPSGTAMSNATIV